MRGKRGGKRGGVADNIDVSAWPQRQIEQGTVDLGTTVTTQRKSITIPGWIKKFS